MALQWSIFSAKLDPAVGHEQAGHRPALVVSAEPLNEHYAVITIAPITSRKGGRPPRLGEVLLPAGTGGLPLDSFVLCYQSRAIDKSMLGKLYGEISDENLKIQIAATIIDCFDLFNLDTASHPDEE